MQDKGIARSVRRAIKNIFIVLAMGATLVLYQNCGGIQQPKASSLSSVVRFSHKVLTNGESCMMCHEKDRKSASHFAGQDCKSCHTTTSWLLVSGGTGHTVSQSECASCHGSGGVRDSIALLKPSHFDIGGEDCLKCHQATKESGFQNWKNGNAHSASLTSCSGCHGAGKDQDSIAAFKPDHFSIGNQDCYQCHSSAKDNGYKNWLGGTFSHSPTQAECASCHGVGQSNDHIAKFKPDHFSIGGKDCLECHLATRNGGYKNWSGGLYVHSTGDISGKSCASCHDTNSKPRPSIGKWMKQDPNAGTTHYGKFDCYFCHKTTNSWGDWNSTGTSHMMAGGGKIEFCLPCHYSKKDPTSDPNGNTTSRISKHSSQTSWFTPPIYDINAVGNHPGANGKLGKCYSCHNVKRRSFDE